ncbi:MAG: EAL domain-containing protein [Oscillospiraceae bacterium]|jgi:EAL domain-containing protein (putative c-di-GMP-specific phosphodiesterase class I)|nr:EAL domain-containing protein [Oscillospiraceae bacterium]
MSDKNRSFRDFLVRNYGGIGNIPAKGPVLDKLQNRFALEDLLYRSLKNDRFEIYYQPLYTICDGKFTEAEALLRLKDDTGKFIPPECFIPVAEQDGLIVSIGSMVLEKVCKYIRYLLACRIDIDSISVNLSVVQLMQQNAVSQLLDIIRRNSISPNRIRLEVTESTLISNFVQAGQKIRELSTAGIQFALDDFGTGYSNITDVIDLPFDEIKLDKSLIWDSIGNERCSVVIRELTKIFRQINLGVTAEGVETAEHDNFARQCGCNKIQGFRYAKPMPVSQADDFFGRRAL